MAEDIWAMGVPATGNCISMQILHKHLLWQQTIVLLYFSRFFWMSVTEKADFKKCWHTDMSSPADYNYYYLFIINYYFL